MEILNVFGVKESHGRGPGAEKFQKVSELWLICDKLLADSAPDGMASAMVPAFWQTTPQTGWPVPWRQPSSRHAPRRDGECHGASLLAAGVGSRPFASSGFLVPLCGARPDQLELDADILRAFNDIPFYDGSYSYDFDAK